MTVQKTLAELVAIDSVSSRSNAEIVDYLAQRCEAIGLKLKRLPYTDVGGVEKLNLIALSGSEFSEETAVELALVGHTDTVPYDPNWNEALQLTESEGKLFGRGACDTKAFIAATLTAIETVELKTLRRPIALVFTADEEIGLLGAKRLAEARTIHPRYAIVGEPTSLQPMRAGKGYCLAEVTIMVVKHTALIRVWVRRRCLAPRGSSQRLRRSRRNSRANNIQRLSPPTPL